MVNAMKYFFKKFRREISGSLGQLLAIIIVVAIGISFYVGLSYAYDTLNQSIDKEYSKSNLPDYWLTYNNIDSQGINEIKKNENIKFAEGRIQMNAISDSDKELQINSFDEENNLSKPRIIEGSYPIKNDEIVLNSSYTDSNNIQIDDIIDVDLGKKYNLKVVGTFESAEYMYFNTNPTQPVPDHKKMGIGLVSIDFFDNIPIEYNQVLIQFKDNEESESTIENIINSTNEYDLLASVEKKDSMSFSMLKNRLDIVSNMRNILPVIFILVASAITFISMSRQVTNQRSQIGIMKALGLSERKILLNFLFYPFFVAILGTILGAVIGVSIFPKIIISTFSILFVLPPLSQSSYLLYILVGFMVTLLFGALATYFSCNKILKEVPASALRPLPPKKAKKNLLESVKFIWKNLSNTKRLTIRNISVNKRRFLLSALGVIFCVSLMIGSLGLRFGLSEIISSEFEKFRDYDMNIVLKEPTKEENLSDFQDNDFNRIDYQSMMPVQFENEYTSLNIINEDSQSQVLYKKDKIIEIKSNGVYVSEKFAEDHNLNLGDEINFKMNSPLIDEDSVRAEIIDVYTSYTSQGFYVTYEFLENVDIDFPITNVLMKVANGKNIKDIRDQVLKKDSVSNVAMIDEQKSEYQNASQSINIIIIIMLIASALLTFTVIFNISSINIEERSRDIATLKVLGFSSRDINNLIFLENYILTTISAVVGTLLSFKVYSFLSTEIVSGEMALPATMNYWSIVLSIIFIYVFTFLTNLSLKRKIRKIDMIESLKSVE